LSIGLLNELPVVPEDQRPHAELLSSCVELPILRDIGYELLWFFLE
jgi:hypothetical protein